MLESLSADQMIASVQFKQLERRRLDLVKHLIIKISERSFTQRFDDSMSSLSSERE